MNIFVAKMSSATTGDDLATLFGEFGTVSSAKVITDRESGRSRGFGFVEMKNDDEGQKAISELNEAEYDGRIISVAVARPRTERSNNGSYNRNSYNSNRRY